MKLKNVIICGFKSIKGTEDFLIDDRITILIGANDHGKSNILEAIQKLNDDHPILETDRNWDSTDKQVPRIEWHFKIATDELLSFANQENQDNEPITPGSPSNSSQVTHSITSENQFDINAKQELVFYKEGVNTPLKVFSVPIKINKEKEGDLLKTRPKIEAFSPLATNLKDQVTLAELIIPANEFMQGIFHLAGLWDHKDIIFTNNDRTARLLDDASKRLTQVLNDKWNQGRDLEWKLSNPGNSILIQIKDPSIENRFTRPSLRSSGFQTFFILSMMINARKYNNTSSMNIFLFDEPGTYLHPYAQLDLQRSFEASADNSQIIYTTHSIFLINKNYPGRNRVISKTKDGTKIDQKPFQKNWKSVRDSLGILMSNNFLIAEKTLLVEGPSDIIYLLDVINRMKKENKIDIDLNDFSIVDAGDSVNYVAITKLLLSEGRDIVALLDGDKSGSLIEEKLKKVCHKELKDGHLVIKSLPKNKSIEDLFCNIGILHEALLNLTNELIDSKVRTLAVGIDIVKEVKKIRTSESETLGFQISEKSKSWFKEQDKLSKLSVSLIYEDLAKTKEIQINSQAIELIKSIKDLMKLKGEKSADKGVFEEIPN